MSEKPSPERLEMVQEAPMPVRYKAWDDLKEHERIERLREVVKQQAESIQRLAEENRRMARHFHTKDGALAVPFKEDSYLGQCEAKLASSKPWF